MVFFAADSLIERYLTYLNDMLKTGQKLGPGIIGELEPCQQQKTKSLLIIELHD